MKTEKPEIRRELILNDKGEIQKFEGKIIVKKMGASGYITVPKKLIGKRIYVLYEKEIDE